MTETWKIIESFPKYEVSTWGKVRIIANERNVHTTYAGRQLTPLITEKGYLRVAIYDSKYQRSKFKRISRLVAETFLGPCPEGLEVNHKDGDKKNNRIDNLEYVSHMTNMQHCEAKGLRKPFHGIRWKTNKVSMQTAQVFSMLSEQGMSQRAIAKRFGLSQHTVNVNIHNIRNLSAQAA